MSEIFDPMPLRHEEFLIHVDLFNLTLKSVNMLRLAAAYVLIATSVVTYLVVSREQWVGRQEHSNLKDGITERTRSRYGLEMRNGRTGISSQRRRMLGGSDAEKRLAVELAMVAHDLQKVSHLVDWEKLHDEYLIAIYSDDSSSHRQLKKRAARPRHKGQRKKEWNLASIEENLEKEALQAIEEAKGFAAPKNSGGGTQEGSGSSVVETAVKVAQDVDATDSLSDSTTDERSPDSPSAVAPVASLAPVNPVSTAASGGGDHAADGDEFPINARNGTGGKMPHAKQAVRASDQQGNYASFNGKPIPVYVPSKGNCPGDGDVAVIPIPCAPDNLNQICNKYDPAGSFSACFDACKPSFCCIHDAPPESNEVAPNCNKDVNCAQYGICYIAWWKLHDTVGPATQLRLEQNDDFFDIDATTINEDQTNSEFYREMLFHHFDNSSAIINLGTVKVNATLAVFSSDLIFLNETYWNTTI